MINQEYKITFIAYRYYKIKHPERKYNHEQARKQFIQDQNKDVAILKIVVTDIYKEQIAVLSTHDKI